MHEISLSEYTLRAEPAIFRSNRHSLPPGHGCAQRSRVAKAELAPGTQLQWASWQACRQWAHGWRQGLNLRSTPLNESSIVRSRTYYPKLHPPGGQCKLNRTLPECSESSRNQVLHDPGASRRRTDHDAGAESPNIAVIDGTPSSRDDERHSGMQMPAENRTLRKERFLYKWLRVRSKS
jgi:hypothetical protein